MNKFSKRVLALAAIALIFPAAILAAETATPVESNIPKMLEVGTKAPNFTRTTASGQKLSLKSFRGKKTVLLYFYPKDETPNCTKEACGFRDLFAELKGVNAAVIGVSGDSDESHKSFAEHYSLQFPLISDSDNSLLDLYHVPFYKGSLHKRVTFVIDKHGIIRNVISDTNDGDIQVKEATAALQVINKE